jgi:hypothetical protein
VHHTHGPAVVLGFCTAGEGQFRLLCHRQAVHVRAQRDDGPALPTPEHGDDAVFGDAGARLQTQAPECLDEVLRGLRLAVRQLGMLMEMATPGEHVVFDRGDASIHVHWDARGRRRLDPPGRWTGKERENHQERRHCFDRIP